MASVHDQIISSSNQSTVAKAAQDALNGTNKSSTSVSSKDFLFLLTQQLQYQDPMNPMDNSQMLAQEAQFSTLEQMEALTSSFSKFSSVYQANSLLGQQVEVNIDGNVKKGRVDFVDFSDTNGASVNINGTAYPLDSVTKVYPQDTTEIDNANKEDRSFFKDMLYYIGSGVNNISNILLGSMDTNNDNAQNDTPQVDNNENNG